MTFTDYMREIASDDLMIAADQHVADWADLHSSLDADEDHPEMETEAEWDWYPTHRDFTDNELVP